ncbi:hypothetical protein FB451DRAFT_1285452 [Mycena latifolia]|nr:hypothetical protein FB451DRAFT_1285452 [Mycena latifolia]
MSNTSLKLRSKAVSAFPGTKTNKEDDQEADSLSRLPRAEAPRTARNALILALQTLSSVARNTPIGAFLSSAIDALLDIANRIEQVAGNTQGLAELAARIEFLTPIVSEMLEDSPEKSRVVINALRRELQSITEDLNDAISQNKLEQFFNSADTASSVAKHNTTLAQMIADSTFVAVHEVLKSLHDLERKLVESSAALIPPGQVEMGDIIGGFGGTGGSGRIGGEGGEGGGPKLEMSHDEDWKIGNISGGTGGTGGTGIEVGGKGGRGGAPVIRMGRRNPTV